LSDARAVCSIPSGKSQCVEGGRVFAAWLSGQCDSLLIEAFVVHQNLIVYFFVFVGKKP